MTASSSAPIVAFHMTWVEAPFLGMKFSQTTSTSAQNVCFLLVYCVVSTNSLTMAAAGAIRPRHLANASIQWLSVKPWTCSTKRTQPQRKMGERGGGMHNKRGVKEEGGRWRMLATTMMVVVSHYDLRQQRSSHQSTTLVTVRSKEGCTAVPWVEAVWGGNAALSSSSRV